MSDREELQSSEYWQHEVQDDFTVLDPDGWDRKNFDESWSEPITFQEFLNRCWYSTLVGPGMKKYL